MALKILITGSRSWADKEMIHRSFSQHKPTSIVHGNARGADNLANEVALELGIDIIVYPAEWDKWGKSAGIIRNRLMLDREKPDVVFAFWDGKSKGTKHMIDYAKQKGYVVQIYLPWEPWHGDR